MTPCPSQDEISRSVRGGADETQADSLLRHAETCAACREAVDRLLEEDTLASALRRQTSLDPYAAEPGCRRTLDRLAAAGTPVSTGAETVWAPLPRGISFDTLPVRLGEYRLDDLLGKGGMGMVFRAEHVRLGKTVAVKVLRPDDARAADWAARFARETRAAGQLSHPNIVIATDAGEVDGMPFLVMECLSGADLGTLTARLGPLPVAAACACVAQAARGLHHAHERGMVHRDVKPANLMLTAGGVKVLDLGLALLAEAQHQGAGQGRTVSGTIMGTVDYMAPEQADDVHAVDARADIYSLGCALFHLVTGQVPYADPTLDTMLRKLNAHASQPIPSTRRLRPEVPAELDNILGRMMAKRPDERYASAALVAAALEPFAAGADVARLLDPRGSGGPVLQSAPTPPAATPLPPSVRPRRRNLLALTAALAGILLVGGAVVLRLASPEGTLVVHIDGPDVEARVRGKELILEDKATKRTYTLKLTGKDNSRTLPPGDYLIAVAGDDGLSFTTREFIIKRQEHTPVRVRVETPRSADTRPAAAPVRPAPPVPPATPPAATSFPALDPDWLARVQALPAKQRLQEVLFELCRRNPNLSARWHNDPEPQIDMDKIVGVSLRDRHVRDLTPFKALPELRTLNVFSADANTPMELEDLSTLAGLPLTHLSIEYSKVADLRPLAGMPLIGLQLYNGCGVSDLRPLRHMPLETLWMTDCPLSDLSPIRDMPKLSALAVSQTRVADLTPLKGREFRQLHLSNCPLQSLETLRDVKLTGAVELCHLKVTDFSPLRDQSISTLRIDGCGPVDLEPLRRLPLVEIKLDYAPARHHTSLRAFKGLKTINELPAKKFWNTIGKAPK